MATLEAGRLQNVGKVRVPKQRGMPRFFCCLPSSPLQGLHLEIRSVLTECIVTLIVFKPDRVNALLRT